MKRLVALSLVLLLSIESFGAVVSDNDGSAFITKAEFDSLKNNFQSQIDQYNTSIDSKIDGAIASYLAGIQVAKTTNKQVVSASLGSVEMLKQSTLPAYSYGRLGLNYDFIYFRNPYSFTDMLTAFNNQGGGSYINWPDGLTESNQLYFNWLYYFCNAKCTATPSKKNVISDVEDYNGGKVARFMGHATNVIEKLSGFMYFSEFVRSSQSLYNCLGKFAWYPETTAPTDNFAIRTDLFSYNFNGSNNDIVGASDLYPRAMYASNGDTHSYNDWRYECISIFDDGNYSAEFSLYNDNTRVMDSVAKTEARSVWRSNVSIDATNSQNQQFQMVMYNDGRTIWNQVIDVTGDYMRNPATIYTGVDTTIGAPQFGFHNLVTKWNQVYNKNISNIAYQQGNSSKAIKYLMLTDGIPMFQTEKESKVKYKFKFNDNSNYYVYLKYGAFNGTPVESNCIDVKYTDTSGNVVTAKKALISNGTGSIEFEVNDTVDLVYIKWTKVGDSGSGTLLLTGEQANYIIEKEF